MRTVRRKSSSSASRPRGARCGGCRPKRWQHGLYGFHETRLFGPFPFTGRQTFLLERTRPRPTVFTNHETRNTAFFRRGCARDAQSETLARSRRAPRPFAASLRVVARHGAAMARHGRRPSPAPATRPVWFSPITAFWPFPFTGRQTFLLERTRPRPTVFTNHETRNTAFFRRGCAVRRKSGAEGG